MRTIRSCFFVLAVSINALAFQAFGQDADTIRMFRLQHSNAVEAVETIEQLLPPTTGIRIVIDDRTNSLIIKSENQKELDQIQELVRQIDTVIEPKAVTTQMLELTVMLVVEGVDPEVMDQLMPPPPDQVQRLIEEMAANPYLPVLKNPRMGGILMNRIVLTHAEKRNSSVAPGNVRGKSTSRDGFCELNLVCQVWEFDPERFMLAADINIQLKPNIDEAFSSKLQTQVAVTKKHPVILGLASIEGVDCLVIVEIR